MEKNDDFHSVNEKEIMEYYNFKGTFGKFKLRTKFLKSWILHSLAYSSPLSEWIITMQRARGVKIGKNCYFSPYVQLDLLYPQLITIEDNVGIGSNSIIFVHSNPTANLYLKNHGYPRKVEPVKIKSGAVIAPGTIITSGVTIGKNSMTMIGSVIGKDVPDNCVVGGNPARVIKIIDVD